MDADVFVTEFLCLPLIFLVVSYHLIFATIGHHFSNPWLFLEYNSAFVALSTPLILQVQQQLANRKHVFSVRSSIRPNQSWPPLLRQQSPCTQGSTLL